MHLALSDLPEHKAMNAGFQKTSQAAWKSKIWSHIEPETSTSGWPWFKSKRTATTNFIIDTFCKKLQNKDLC